MNDYERLTLQQLLDELQDLMDLDNKGLSFRLWIDRLRLGISNVKLRIWELLNRS